VAWISFVSADPPVFEARVNFYDGSGTTTPASSSAHIVLRSISGSNVAWRDLATGQNVAMSGTFHRESCEIDLSVEFTQGIQELQTVGELKADAAIVSGVSDSQASEKTVAVRKGTNGEPQSSS